MLAPNTGNGMLNETRKIIVYLDPDTLGYMFLSYTKRRNYPVMNKLFSLLRDGYHGDMLVTPLSIDHVAGYIEESKIDHTFLTMMGEFGQLQFLQRFTVKMLQLIRVVNFYFGQVYKKDMWRDIFTSDPDHRYEPGFNMYNALTAQNVMSIVAREKKLSRTYHFIENYKEEQPVEHLVADHFTYLWQEFPDLIKPFLPVDGLPDDHMNSFLKMSELQDIPEFHLISQFLYPLFDTYGMKDIEYGSRDGMLLAAETAAAYMP